MVGESGMRTLLRYVGRKNSVEFEGILVVVDRLSKYSHFIPLKHPYTVRSIANVLCHVNIAIEWYIYDAWDVINYFIGIIKLWLRLCVSDNHLVCNELWITRVLRCMYWVVSYELCDHTIVRSFKDDELMCDELWWVPLWEPDEFNHLRRDELK